MRPRLVLPSLAALLLAGCDDSPIGPPTGLPAQLRPIPGTMTTIIEPQVFIVGDTIVAMAPGGISDCSQYGTTAGRVRDVVVVTLTTRPTSYGCTGTGAPAMYRIEVWPIPRGASEVRFYERHLDAGGNTTFQQGLVRYNLNWR